MAQECAHVVNVKFKMAGERFRFQTRDAGVISLENCQEIKFKTEERHILNNLPLHPLKFLEYASSGWLHPLTFTKTTKRRDIKHNIKIAPGDAALHRANLG